jgi:hypothetical protein
MATEKLNVDRTAGQNVYFAVFDPVHTATVFDFSDNTFKALGSATTPYIAATEETDGAGTGISLYVASLNLAALNPLPATKHVVVYAYQRAGGSPNLLTDTMFSRQELRLANSVNNLDAAAIAAMRIGFDAAVTSTAGTSLKMIAWLRDVGGVVIDGSATCVITCREHGAGVLLFTNPSSGTASQTDYGTFEVTQSTPGFTDDRLYVFDVTIVSNGVTYEEIFTMPVIG